MTSDAFRLPAEWEPVEAVLLSWPHADTDWAYMLDQVRSCFIQIVESITKYAHVIIVAPDANEVRSAFARHPGSERILIAEMPTNDTWARDFGMICTVSNSGKVKANDFKFNGWGLKFAACHDNLVTNHMRQMLAEGTEYVNRLNFVFEGGSIESDGHGTLMTTTNCLLSPNRNGELSQEEIEHYLLQALGGQKMLWVHHGDLEGDDTDSHIDTLARFLPGNIIASSTCDRADDSHYKPLRLMTDEIRQFTDAKGQHYQLVELPIPNAIYDDEGQRLPATYANFLIVNDAVLVPIYDDPVYDTIALDRITKAMPTHTVIGIDCRVLICQHGSLHCMTMQIPTGTLR